MSATDQEFESVVKTVRRWPPELQFSLVHEMLHIIAAGQAHRSKDGPSEVDVGERPRRSTLAHAIGLLRTADPPPTDDEVRRLLEERRIEKFG
ncbi:MAG: hypothetical protein AB7R89_29465 [Dehalococcoidia bacterium]